jgi:serine/threonine-protein kinase
MTGTKLGHYAITGHLGSGGMGEVYQATDTKLGRNVAIKVLPEAFSHDADRAVRFEREAKALASLNHPNVAAIYGLEEVGPTKFLVLELVEGDTLADRLRSGAMPADEALRLALQIAHALEAAHEKGIIHRDIKPANIKITPEGKAKVLDFGLAKAFTPDNGSVNLSNSPTMSIAATEQGIILGTASYMSPEQASGGVVDKRADVWAFGVVLFEMLTGRKMFTGKTVSHVLADVLKAPPDWSSLPTNLHARIRLLLERCLEKEPRDRYHDIADARVDIERVLADPRGVLVSPGADASSATRTVSLRQAWTWIAVTAVVAGALGWFLRPEPGRAPRPVLRSVLLLPDSTQFTGGQVSMLAISPDGTRVAYSANSQIYLQNLKDTRALPVPGTTDTGFIAAPVFSPDGTWLAYVHAVTTNGPFSIKRISLSGGPPLTVLEFKEGARDYPWGLSWPDPDKMVFAGLNGIVRVPVSGGATELLIRRNAGEVFESPQILPGGEDILFVRLPGEEPGQSGVLRWDTAELVIQSIGKDNRTVLFTGGSHPRYLPSGHVVYAQEGTLFALSVDLDSRKVTGGPVPVVESVRRTSNGFSDAAQYAVSVTGILVTIPRVAAPLTDRGLLALMDRKGNTKTLPLRPAQYRSPRFSPDDRQIAVQIIGDDGQSHIWIYDLSGKSEIRRLTQTGDNVRPIWNPVSKRVTFGSNREGSWGLFEQPTDSSALPVRLSTAEARREHYPDSWSPNGKILVYVEVSTGNNWDLWSLSDNSPALLIGDPLNQFGTAFSPNGDWIVYTDVTTPFGIRALRFPRTGVSQQITQDGEAWPIWLATGEIVFRNRRDNAENPPELKGINVTTTGEFTFRNPRTLQLPKDVIMNAGYRDYDATRNGDSFVIILPEKKPAAASPPAAAPRIDVVLNWFEELKERLPGR